MKSDSIESPIISEPLGLALKEARIAASLSIDEVAHKLNLGVTTVRDIEEELANVLVEKKYPAIYLRGYLANYAKLVELEGLASFSEYQQLETERKTKKTLPKSPLIIPPPRKKTRKLLPLTLLLVIVVAFVAYLAETQFFTSLGKINLSSELMPVLAEQKKLMLEKKEDENVVSKPIMVQAKTPNTKDTDISEGSLNSAHELAVIDTKVDKIVEAPKAEVTATIAETSEPITQVSEPIAAVLVPSVEPSQPVTKILQPTREPSALIAQIPESVVEYQETIAGIEQPLAENVEKNIEVAVDIAPELAEKETDAQTGIDLALVGVATELSSSIQPEVLMLEFTAECWTEIFDATGKRIAFGLYKSGRVLTLNGIAPFKLKLGDPSVVEIQYQDQVIDGEFTPGRSAQFSVPLS